MPLDHFVTLGRSGLRVSPFCLGGMTFGEERGWGSSVAESEEIIDQYLDHGGNFIDTANSYNRGHSEKIIGDHVGCHPARRDRSADTLRLIQECSVPLRRSRNRPGLQFPLRGLAENSCAVIESKAERTLPQEWKRAKGADSDNVARRPEKVFNALSRHIERRSPGIPVLRYVGIVPFGSSQRGTLIRPVESIDVDLLMAFESTPTCMIQFNDGQKFLRAICDLLSEVPAQRTLFEGECVRLTFQESPLIDIFAAIDWFGRRSVFNFPHGPQNTWFRFPSGFVDCVGRAQQLDVI